MIGPSNFGPTMGGAGWAAALPARSAGRRNRRSPISRDAPCWSQTIPTPWAACGEILGNLNRWDEAAESYNRWSALGGDPGPIPWYYHAALRVYANDEPGYRHACQIMMKQFGAGHRRFRGVAGGPRVQPWDRSWSFPRPSRRPRPAGRPRQAPRRLVELYPGIRALAGLAACDDAQATLETAARVDPGWTGTPLIVAQRELTKRAMTSRRGSHLQPVHPASEKHATGPERNETAESDSQVQRCVAVSSRGDATRPRA